MYKTYVVFKLPGSFIAEQTEREVQDRSFPTDVPKNCFGFYFYDIYEATGPKGELISGTRQNVSAMTYFGEEFTLERVKRECPNSKVLISNMECNGWNRVVCTRLGNWQPLEDGDRVIDGLANWRS